MSVYSNNKYDKSRANDAWTKLANFIPENSRVLDVGCSSGQLGMALKKDKKLKVVGIDIDREDVDRAKANLGEAYLLNVENDDLSHLGKFDVIVFADVIEHLYNPVQALKKVSHLLNTGGRIVFSIPNMANVTIRLELLKGRFGYKDFGLLDKTHVHFYDSDEVERVFSDAGYSIKKYDCTVRLIPQPILKKELNKVGIELTPTLVQLFDDTDGAIYQFIGYAQQGKNTHAKRETSSSLDSVTREIDSMREQYDRQIQNLNETLRQKETEVEHYKERLLAILNSKGWKLLQKGYAVKHKINKKR